MGVAFAIAPAPAGPGRRRRSPAKARGTHDDHDGEHPVHTLQRTIGNQATTKLIAQRQEAMTIHGTGGLLDDPAPGKSTDPTPLRPDASQEELHAEYERGNEMYHVGLWDEAAAVWIPVYAHPMSRGDSQRKANLALVIGRAKQRGGHSTEAISWFQEVIVTPGVDSEAVVSARQFIVSARRGSEEEQGGGGESLPPDATPDDLHAAYIEGTELYAAGLYDEAASKFLAVYEHKNTTPEQRCGVAMRLGDVHFHAHRFDQAISWYEESMTGEGYDHGARDYLLDKIARCRRGSVEDSGIQVGDAIDPDAGDDVLQATYHEGTALYDAGLFEAAIGKWVQVYEHKNTGNEKRPYIALRIGTAYHQLLQFGPAVSWYTEALLRGFDDVGNVSVDRKLAQARDGKPMVTNAVERRPQISEGSAGAHVRFLQERLTAFGFDLAVDGFFGALTDGQVRKFQAHNGLAADGIVGPRTWQVLS